MGRLVVLFDGALQASKLFHGTLLRTSKNFKKHARDRPVEEDDKAWVTLSLTGFVALLPPQLRARTGSASLFQQFREDSAVMSCAVEVTSRRSSGYVASLLESRARRMVAHRIDSIL